MLANIVKCSLVLSVTSLASSAEADPLKMQVITKGSFLEVDFQNVSSAPVAIASHLCVGAIRYGHICDGSRHYDSLTVRLIGRTTRTLHFVEPRASDVPVLQTMQPGYGITRSIDLEWWATRGGNGGPLAPGVYELVATWDATEAPLGLRFNLTAKTTLTVPTPTTAQAGRIPPR